MADGRQPGLEQKQTFPTDKKEVSGEYKKYTFEYMNANLKDGQHYSPSEKYKFQIGKKGVFCFILGHTPQRPSGAKFHFNFAGDKKQQAKAWNAMVKVLLDEPELVNQAKICIADLLAKNDSAFDEGLKKYSAAVKNVKSLDDSERKAIEEDLKLSEEQFKDEVVRRQTSGHCTLYIQTDAKGAVNEQAYQKLLAKIVTALKEAEIKESATPDSDFRVCEYVSMRIDRDRLNEPIDIYQLKMQPNWEYFCQHELVKKFVSADELKREPPVFVPEASFLRGQRSPVLPIMKTAVEILINPLFLPAIDYWKNQAKGNKIYLDAIDKIKTILEFKKMRVEDKFRRIAGVCESVVDQVGRSKKDLFAKPDPIYKFFEMFASDRNIKNNLMDYFNKIYPEVLEAIKPQESSEYKKNMNPHD
jgi:hypothetical protein